MGQFISQKTKGRNLLASGSSGGGRNLLNDKSIAKETNDVNVQSSPEIKFGEKAGVREFALAGAPGFSMSPGGEDVLPAVGQLLGGKYGPVAAGGAAIGEFVRQSAKALRGDPSGFKEPKALSMGPIGLSRSVPSVADEALMTLTIEGATRGLGKVIPGISNRLMNSVLKPGTRTLSKQPALGREAAELGLTGTLRGIERKAENLIQANLNKIDDILKGSKSGVDVTDVSSSLDDLKRRFVNTGNKLGVKAVNEMKQLIFSKAKGNKIPIDKANRLKRDLFAELKDVQFGTAEVAPSIAAKKAVTGGLRKGIEAAEPTQPIGALNREIQTALRTGKAAENRLATQGRSMIIPKLAGIGAGGLALSGNIPAGIGVLIGDRLIDLARSTPIISGTAKNLLRAKQVGRPLTLAAAEAVRRLSRLNQ